MVAPSVNTTELTAGPGGSVTSCGARPRGLIFSMSFSTGLLATISNSPDALVTASRSIQDIVPLRVARVNLPTLISIRVGVGANGASGASMDKAEELNQLFARKRGETEVRLRLEKPRDFSVILDVAPKVRPDKEFWAEVERICGPESLEILAS